MEDWRERLRSVGDKGEVFDFDGRREQSFASWKELEDFIQSEIDKARREVVEEEAMKLLKEKGYKIVKE